SQTSGYFLCQGRHYKATLCSKYLFVLQSEKLVCLLCYEMSVTKEYNLHLHFDTKHGAKYAKFSLQEKHPIVQELKDRLQKNDAAVKCILKQCMLQVCDQVCPNQIQTFKNVSLSRNTITDTVNWLFYNKNELSWERLVGQTTDGAPAMCGEKKQALYSSCKTSLITYHCFIHQKALCGRVLKLDDVMTAVMKTVNFLQAHGLNRCQFQLFMQEVEIGSWRHAIPNRSKLKEEMLIQSKVKPLSELSDPNWLCDFPMLSGITEQFTLLNQKQMFDIITAFQHKLDLWKSQIKQDNLAHFPVCQSISASFDQCFSDFKGQHLGCIIFAHPFTTENCSQNFGCFYHLLPPGLMPQLWLLVAHVLCMFESTYLCKQMFSVMKLNKTKHRSHITNYDLHTISRIASAQDLIPDIDTLAMTKQCETSSQKYIASRSSQQQSWTTLSSTSG
uniref:DUF4371 domain-containing protein n=1 Tax=Acanthochromis polyacanthus TaxID=80966 RepID=A0A3Q1H4B2_9TELE